uniref:Uncharacterized protein n=1 Tax=Panagrolaimus superbus TaxID=310955 RepID=A0A914YJX0_9BILA
MVTLAHRHFDLADNEVMLETTYGDIRVAKPVDIEQLSAFGVQPVLLACINDSDWCPVGYGIDEISLPAWKDQKFLKDVGAYLTKNHLHDKLLLTTRSLQDEKKMDGFQYLETNHKATRTSKVELVEEKDLKNSVETTFGFARGPHGEVEQRCNNWCGCDDC